MSQTTIDRLVRFGTASPAMRIAAQRILDRPEEAIERLGGAASPAGSCVLAVIVRGEPLYQWAWSPHSWTKHPLSVETARGVLIAALGLFVSEDDGDR